MGYTKVKKQCIVFANSKLQNCEHKLGKNDFFVDWS